MTAGYVCITCGTRSHSPPTCHPQPAQVTLGDWAPAAHNRVDEYDDDPTPRPVVRAVLEAVFGGGPPYKNSDVSMRLAGVLTERGGPVRVLDIGAGFGCWSSELRRLADAQGWPVHITGVELNPNREQHLRKWCDMVLLESWRDALAWLGDCNFGLDLVIGNPPFAHLLADGKGTDHREDPATTMVPVLLEHAPAVVLLHTQQALLKSECGRAVQRLCPPAAAWQLPGAVQFRAGINPKNGKPWGADSRCYEATLWLRGHSGPCSRYLLPELTAAERRWTVPPGSESPAEARALGLPLAPGYA